MKDLSSHPFNCSDSIKLKRRSCIWFSFFLAVFFTLLFFILKLKPKSMPMLLPSIALLGIFFRWRHRNESEVDESIISQFRYVFGFIVFIYFFTIASVWVCVCVWIKSPNSLSFTISSIEWNMKRKWKTLALQLCLKITHFIRLWNWQTLSFELLLWPILFFNHSICTDDHRMELKISYIFFFAVSQRIVISVSYCGFSWRDKVLGTNFNLRINKPNHTHVHTMSHHRSVDSFQLLFHSVCHLLDWWFKRCLRYNCATWNDHE